MKKSKVERIRDYEIEEFQKAKYRELEEARDQRKLQRI